MDMEVTENRLRDLAEGAYQKGHYTFTDFLSPGEVSLYMGLKRELDYVHSEAFGGTADCERLMVRFGSPEELGYEEEFPIKCIRVEPLMQKFADQLSHRDFLGALMNLGIDRSLLGDITVQENVGYLFCVSRMADYICRELTKVKHTSVRCQVTEEIPENFMGQAVPIKILAESERLDGIVAKVYKLSRAESLGLFGAKKIFVNSMVCENNSMSPKAGDLVSVRGYGRFRYGGVLSESKKGKKNISIELYKG